MKAVKSTNQLLSEARQLADESRLTESASLYQRLLDADPTNQQAVARLLTVYRRLKEPKKELAVIQTVLAAYAQKDKATQEKWLSTHPQAAKAGRAFLRSLGGSSVSSFGANAQVQRLQKRKEVVEKKLYGKAAPKQPASPKPTATRKPAATPKPTPKKPTAKKSAAATRQSATAAKKAAAIPSLFIISLRYLAPLEAIDAILPKHVAFLDKHFAAGDFLVAGRQIPRTGGIIIARAKDRTAIERIMKQDPFLKNKLATLDIVEFAASKLNPKQWQQIK